MTVSRSGWPSGLITTWISDSGTSWVLFGSDTNSPMTCSANPRS
jgi:hypothetical protein